MLPEEVRIGCHELLGGIDEHHGAVGVGELEGRVELALVLQLVCPDDEMPVGRNDGVEGRCRGNLVLEGFFEVVADVESGDVEVGVGGVVELEPVVLLEVVVDEYGVAGADLVDLDGCRCRWSCRWCCGPPRR